MTNLIESATDLPDARHWRRRKPITATVVHTWQGIKQRIVQAAARPKSMLAVAKWWDRKRRSGAEFLVTGDKVGQTVDHTKWFKAHCHSRALHRRCVGLEMDQRKDGRITIETMRTTAALALELHELHGIQWQCQWPFVGPIWRVRNQRPITIGLFGHRDVTSRRSIWDPGNTFYEIAIDEFGCEPMDFSDNEDRDRWELRQLRLRRLNLYHGAIDGLPGRGTTAALWAHGYVGGIYSRGLGAEMPEGEM